MDDAAMSASSAVGVWISAAGLFVSSTVLVTPSGAELADTRGARALACLVLRDSELAYLSRSLIKPLLLLLLLHACQWFGRTLQKRF